jgi:uncharacterized repeat protein (TIGR01451 family)
VERSIPAASLSAVKTSTPSSGSEVKPGDEIAYTITVTNTDSSDASNVVVTDVIPVGTAFVSAQNGGVYGLTKDGVTYAVQWVIPSIASGASAAVRFTVRVLPLMGHDTQAVIENVGYVGGLPGTQFFDPDEPTDSGDPSNPREPTNKTEHVVRRPDIAAVKSSAPPSGTIVSIPTVITYTITVKNNGLDTATNVIVIDPVPAGTTLVSGSISSDGIFGFASDSESVVVQWIIPEIQAGQSVYVSFEVSVNPLASGESYRVMHNVAYTGGPVGPSYYNPNNPTGDSTNPRTPTNETEHILRSEYGVHITKSASPASGTSVKPGDTIKYTITVHNGGSGDASNLIIADPVPVGTRLVPGSISSGGISGLASDGESVIVQWTRVSVPAGGSVNLSFSVEVLDMPEGQFVGTIRNRAYLRDKPGTGTFDPKNPDGEPSNQTEHPVYIPKLRYNKRSDPPSGSFVQPDSVITYYIDVQNVGMVESDFVVVTDPVPAGTQLLEYSDGHGVVVVADDDDDGDSGDGDVLVVDTADGGVAVRWLLGELAAGERRGVWFSARVLPVADTDPIGDIVNVAYIRETPTEPTDPDEPFDPDDPGDPTNETRTHIYTLIKRSVPASGTTVYIGTEITYTIELSNLSSEPMTGFAITDVIPLHTQYVSSDPDAELVTQGQLSGLVWKLPTLNGGESTEVSFTVRVKSYGWIRNVAYLDPDGGDDYDPNDPEGEPSNPTENPPYNPPPPVTPTPSPEPESTPTPEPTGSPTPEPEPTGTPTPSLTPAPLVSPIPTPEPTATPTPPPIPGVTIMPGDDTFVVVDEDGIPQGEWRWDPDDEVWIYEPYPPLGSVPKTGDDFHSARYAALLIISAAGLFFSATRKKRDKRS